MSSVSVPTPPIIEGSLVLRSTLRSRGWKDKDFEGLTPTVIASEGTQRERAYQLDAVMAREASNASLARRVAEIQYRKDCYIPPTGPYTLENTISHRDLQARGWFGSHITRLLHHADLNQYGQPFAYKLPYVNKNHRYGVDRVLKAEATDHRLQVDIAYRTEQFNRRLTYTEQTGFMFVKHDGKWMIWGAIDDVPQNRLVQVPLKAGGTCTIHLGSIHHRDNLNRSYGYFNIVTSNSHRKTKVRFKMIDHEQRLVRRFLGLP